MLLDTDTAEEKHVVENRFSRPWMKSDIVLIIDEEEFHCHYNILALNSPVFSSMFSDDTLVEGRGKTATLTGKDRNSFILFLNLMYPLVEAIDASNIDVVNGVLGYVDEYQTESVRLRIDLVLSSVKFTHSSQYDECMQMLYVADRYHLKETRQSCISFLSMIFSHGNTEVESAFSSLTADKCNDEDGRPTKRSKGADS